MALLQQDHLYDLIIVGAGISGLSLAASLQELDILILESEDRVGGRVYSRRLCNMDVELGAIFPLTPEDNDSGNINFNKSSVAIYDNSRLTYGSDPIDVLNSIARSQLTDELTDLDPSNTSKTFYNDLFKILTSKDANANLQSSKAYYLVDAFHRLIHPGPLSFYSQSFVKQALTNWPLVFGKFANQKLVEIFQQRLSNSTTIHTNCNVSEISETDDYFEAGIICNGKTFRARSKYCAVTTSTRQLLHILRKINITSIEFYRKIIYMPGIVCAMVIDKMPELPRYIVSADQLWSSIIPIYRDDKVALHFYITGNWTLKVWDKPDNLIAEMLITSLRKMGIHVECLDYAVKRWQELGPILSDNLTTSYQPNHHRLTNKLWYGGEMAMYKPSMPVSYGVTAAIKAGQLVASEIMQAKINQVTA